MTRADRVVKRETYTSVRVARQSRPLIIEIHPTWISIKPKGLRKAFLVSMDQIYNLGARNAAESLRRDRAAARRVKKEARNG